jgi:hypothetical protein
VAVVSISITGREAKVRSPFQAKDLIKEMPVRSWDGREKCWVIPAGDVPVLRSVLEAAGYKVVVTRPEREQYSQPPPPRGARNGDGSWADQMFIALSPELAEKCFKALSRALHPDVGGDTAQMQILNAARDRHGRRS